MQHAMVVRLSDFRLSAIITTEMLNFEVEPQQRCVRGNVGAQQRFGFRSQGAVL